MSYAEKLPIATLIYYKELKQHKHYLNED